MMNIETQTQIELIYKALSQNRHIEACDIAVLYVDELLSAHQHDEVKNFIAGLDLSILSWRVIRGIRMVIRHAPGFEMEIEKLTSSLEKK